MASRQAKANTAFLRPFVFPPYGFFLFLLRSKCQCIRFANAVKNAMACCKIGHYLICILIIRVHELLVDDMISKRNILSSYDHKVILIFVVFGY